MIVRVVRAATSLGKQLVKLNFIEDSVDIVHVPIAVLPTLNSERVRPEVEGKSDGN